jgi:hypothetical protein
MNADDETIRKELASFRKDRLPLMKKLAADHRATERRRMIRSRVENVLSRIEQQSQLGKNDVRYEYNTNDDDNLDTEVAAHFIATFDCEVDEHKRLKRIKF